MILSGVNYVAYFYIMTKQFKEIFKVEEIRVYFGIILGAGAFIAFNIRGLYGTLVRHCVIPFSRSALLSLPAATQLLTLTCGPKHQR